MPIGHLIRRKCVDVNINAKFDEHTGEQGVASAPCRTPRRAGRATLRYAAPRHAQCGAAWRGVHTGKRSSVRFPNIVFGKVEDRQGNIDWLK